MEAKNIAPVKKVKKVAKRVKRDIITSLEMQNTLAFLDDIINDFNPGCYLNATSSASPEVHCGFGY